MGLSGGGEITGRVVFGGYGITSKEKDLRYDDYQEQDVAGKIVIVLRKTPRPGDTSSPFGGHLSGYYGELTNKVANAKEHHAAGILFVSDHDTASNADTLMDFNYTAYHASAGIPSVHARRSAIDSLLRSYSDEALRELLRTIGRD